MPSAAIQSVPLDALSRHLREEALTASQWAQLLDVTRQAFAKRKIASSSMILASGGLTKTYRFMDLPPDYQSALDAQRRRQGVERFVDLLDLRGAAERRWEPAREIATLPPASQVMAERRKRALAVFWTAMESGRNAGQANVAAQGAWMREFGEACSEKTIRRWVQAIESRGGPDLAPIAAYAGLKSEHGKSVPHTAARTSASVPRELIAEYRSRCVKAGMMHIEGAYRSLVLDWQNGREVRGLGFAPEINAPFPYKSRQLRLFAPSSPARIKGGKGNAAAARDAMPHAKNTTAFLRRMERLLLDDSRIDIIATDDLTGRLVELRSMFLIDLGARRIESWVVRERGNMRATDTDALLARALRSGGIAARNANYQTVIRFERGAVACSPARESLLLGAFPGQLRIERTGMEGGRNFGGDFAQSSSGRWMDKSHIESFMRTLAFSLQHVPGQRGGTYARQPAALGLTGKNRATGALEYTRGSQMHEAALLQGAERAMALFEGDLDQRAQQWATHQPMVNGRLRVSAAMPVAWVLDAIREFVSWYNSRTDHRMEGFRRIEYIDPQTGALRHRQESPNERAAYLNGIYPTERISDAAVSRLLMRARLVTVRKNGVSMDLDPYRGLKFWREDSVACYDALRLSTGEKKLVALYDEDALRDAIASGNPGAAEIYLIGNRLENFTSGEPAQFIESMPLCTPGIIGDPHSLAEKNAELLRVQNRYAAELLTAAAPELARRHAELTDNVSSLQAVMTANDAAVRAVSPESPLIRALNGESSQKSEPVTRGEQMSDAQDAYAASLAHLFQSPDSGV